VTVEFFQQAAANAVDLVGEIDAGRGDGGETRF